MIKFCERKIAAAVSGSGGRGGRHLADTESYVLLWQMLVLLLRQKGQVGPLCFAKSYKNIWLPKIFIGKYLGGGQ